MEKINSAVVEAEAVAMGANSLVPDALEALRIEALRRRRITVEEEKVQIRNSVGVTGTTNFTADI